MAVLTLVEGNLFDDKDASLVHCVSRDMHMGRGIAVEFRQRFGHVRDLLHQGADVGQVALLQLNDKRFAFYLVTKDRYYNKPTYKALRDALAMLRWKCKWLGIQTLAMPRIGCGLDKLEWSKVEHILVDIFKYSGITLKVYFLKE